LEDRPTYIRVQIFPYDNEIAIGVLLDELAKPRKHSAGAFIVRYTVGEQRFIQIKSFTAHQRPHPKEPPSKIPRQQIKNGKKFPAVKKHGEPLAGREEGKGREQEGKEDGNQPPAYLPPDVRTENAIRGARWKTERHLLALVGQIAERTSKEAQDVMKEVTAYKRKSDDQLVTGRTNPALLSEERLDKSVEDAEAWLATLPAVAS
jgi:hypothetical protein